MHTDRLEYLFKRHLEKNATPEEEAELLALIRDDANSEQLNKLVDQALAEEHVGDSVGPDISASILASITHADRSGTEKEQKLPQINTYRTKIFKRLAYVAAAIFITTAAGIVYLWNRPVHQRGNEMTTVDVSKNDIAPGNDRAILTLADGSQAKLDSAGTQVFHQGGMVIDQQNGQLRYNGAYANTMAIYNTLTTPKGGQFRLFLPDSTQVWLNAASSLKYPVAFTGDSRTVELTGEAYFEVAKNKSKPFYVKVGDMQVRVLGTHFNIMAYPNEDAIRTTLLEGSVKVSSMVNGQWSMLQPGQQAAIHHSQLTIHDTVDIDQVMAWKNGVFMFNGADLPALLRQFERWYNIDVIYKGQHKSYAFTGTIPRTAHLSTILKLFQVNDIPYTLEKNRLIVKP